MSQSKKREPQSGQFGEMRQKIEKVATEALRNAAKAAKKASPKPASKPKKG